MNYYKFFEFLEQKENRQIPVKFKLLFKLLKDPNYQITQDDVEENGDLNLNSTPIKSLPPGLNIKGWLSLHYSLITSLPPDLSIGGGLLIYGCKNLKSLPSGLRVGNVIDLTGTPITSLPPDLKVGGNLYLMETEITSLPSGLKVKGNLYLRDTPLSKSHTIAQIKQMVPGVKGEVTLK